MGVLEPGVAVERQGTLAGKRELDDQHAADLSGGTIHRILLHAVDPRVWEQRDIEIGRFLGLILEPQAWRYLGHVLR